MKVYLSGAMEHAPDSGREWRDSLETFLHGQIGHEVYNPVRDVRKNLTGEEAAHFRSWKRADPERYRAVLRKIIHYDLDMLEERADYVVCYWDRWCVQGGGTHGELTMAFRRRIPVYLVSEIPFVEISGWILGCCTEVFPSFDELKTFLRRKFATSTHPEEK